MQVILTCEEESTGGQFDGTLARFTATEFSRRDGVVGEHVFSALDDAAAIERVQDRVDAGVYTPTGSRHAPGRVVEEQRS